MPLPVTEAPLLAVLPLLPGAAGEEGLARPDPVGGADIELGPKVNSSNASPIVPERSGESNITLPPVCVCACVFVCVQQGILSQYLGALFRVAEDNPDRYIQQASWHRLPAYRRTERVGERGAQRSLRICGAECFFIIERIEQALDQ